MTSAAAPDEGEVFLTGASGFVGSHVLNALLARGYRVRALVRGPALLPPGVASVHGDLRNPAALVPALRGCRYLVHSAALYSFSPRDCGDHRGGERPRHAGPARGCAHRRHRALRGDVQLVSARACDRCRARSTERSWAEPQPGAVTYHSSKLLQERAALSATDTGHHGAADSADRPGRPPADANRQDRRRPASRPNAGDARAAG